MLPSRPYEDETKGEYVCVCIDSNSSTTYVCLSVSLFKSVQGSMRLHGTCLFSDSPTLSASVPLLLYEMNGGERFSRWLNQTRHNLPLVGVVLEAEIDIGDWVPMGSSFDV